MRRRQHHRKAQAVHAIRRQLFHTSQMGKMSYMLQQSQGAAVHALAKRLPLYSPA